MALVSQQKNRRRLALSHVCAAWLTVCAGAAIGVAPAAVAQQQASLSQQADPAQGRPIRTVRIEGLSREPAGLVRNNLRTTEGQPFDAAAVSGDVKRLDRLGKFRRIDARTELHADGTVTVVFVVQEAPLIEDVQIVGQRKLSLNEIRDAIASVGIDQGAPIDEFRLRRAQRTVEELYRAKGFYRATVLLDQEQLEEEGIVLLRVVEGERTRVTDIRFEGNGAFSVAKLRSRIKTKTRGLFEEGPLDEETLEKDVAILVTFYEDRGYRDVRVDRKWIPSPNGKEAIVTFLVEEGPRYTLRNVVLRNGDDADAPLVFSVEELKGLMLIQPGDVYSKDKLDSTVKAVKNAYLHTGYVDVRVESRELLAAEGPKVDLALTIVEGGKFRTGEILVRGNSLTRHNVIRREVQLRPDDPVDGSTLKRSKDRLDATRLFENVRTTVQAEDPAYPGYRDVLVEVKETSTGSLSFGVQANSDLGFAGIIGFEQRNFDLFDTPESWSEFFSGRSFRGGGQDFSIQLSPGTDFQNYEIHLSEPYLMGSKTQLGLGARWRDRFYSDYDEERIGGDIRLGRRFGDRWIASISLRGEQVGISDIESDAPVDVFAVKDENIVAGLSLKLTRTTILPEERLAPSRGARTELGAEQVFGDFNFTKFSGEHTFFLPLYADFLGRKGVMSVKTTASYIPQSDEAPVYERFYLGGSSFRGFDFRGVSPVGIRNDNGLLGDDPVGGEWSFFFGLEYQHPLWGSMPYGGGTHAIVSGAVFLDTGTVQSDLGFDEYRVAVGVGLRLRIAALSGAPLAFDIAVPLKKQDTDETRFFSFSLDLPF